jgi:two-component system chemotaxis response regulator CheB
MREKIKVLVVDDSSFMRKTISRILESDAGIVVVGTAPDGKFVQKKLESLNPDVITLDVEMAEMDGIQTLRQIMSSNPHPVVMLSSLTQDGADITVKALQLGAVDFVAKPSGQISLDMETQKSLIIEKVKAAAAVEVSRIRRRTYLPKQGSAVAEKSETPRATFSTCTHVVMIGISTGGPQTLMNVLPQLPGDLPAAVVVVQHMPEGFTLSLANRLNEMCEMRVCEAAQGDYLANGTIYIAKGGSHMTITRGKMITIGPEPYGSLYKPCVNVTLDSVSDVFGRNLIAVIMTGMGKDGSQSIVRARSKGARTIAESQETAVIYGMPKEAISTGTVEFVLPAPRVAEKISSIMGELTSWSAAVGN